MANYVTFFPVGNGDMTLFSTEDKVNFLIDCNIRKESEDDESEMYDCNKYLHDNLEADGKQIYLDAFFLTHSDHDHCCGIEEYFNLCAPSDCEIDKIRINELCVPARLLVDDNLTNDDAKALKAEAERRLDLYGKDDFDVNGNRLKIIGYSEDLVDYADIMTVAGETISELNGESDFGCEIFVLRPVKKSTDDEDAGVNECTASFYISFDMEDNTYSVMIMGDVECENWKEVISLNEDKEYDVLLAPHHCSWHAISTEDTSTGSIDASIEEYLRKSKEKAYIIASSKKIKRNADNPPSYRAMNAYKNCIKNDNRFICTADELYNNEPIPVKLKITKQGVTKDSIKTDTKKHSTYTPKSYGEY